MKSGALHDALKWSEVGVYIVRKCRKCPALYIGSTSRGVGWRLRRHLGDGERQPSSKLSGPMRRAWPCDGWVVQLLTPDDVARVTSAGRYLTLAQAERRMQRELHPLLNSVDGETQGIGPEQVSLWAKPEGRERHE